MWFYLNYLGLDEMQYVYDQYIFSITNNESEYKKMLTKGWPYSEFFNLADTNDTRQFSNIILSNKLSSNLMKYKEWELPNIHAFLKYFFILRKTKFKIKFILDLILYAR